jgi:flagellar capping protein FliD
MDVLDGGLNGSATGVSENQDEGHVQLDDRVFDAALDGDTRAVDDIASHSDYENIADSGVEEDLRRDARIRTTYDNGFGHLSLRKGLKLLWAAPGRERVSGLKALIAGQ